jgi:hypothetical protein
MGMAYSEGSVHEQLLHDPRYLDMYINDPRHNVRSLARYMKQMDQSPIQVLDAVMEIISGK